MIEAFIEGIIELFMHNTMSAGISTGLAAVLGTAGATFIGRIIIRSVSLKFHGTGILLFEGGHNPFLFSQPSEFEFSHEHDGTQLGIAESIFLGFS